MNCERVCHQKQMQNFGNLSTKSRSTVFLLFVKKSFLTRSILRKIFKGFLSSDSYQQLKFFAWWVGKKTQILSKTHMKKFISLLAVCQKKWRDRYWDRLISLLLWLFWCKCLRVARYQWFLIIIGQWFYEDDCSLTLIHVNIRDNELRK